MNSPPARETLAFLFTDLESSTQRWERFPDAMKTALERHDEILRGAVERSDGEVVKTTGDGLMAVFSSIGDGVLACLDGQRRIQEERWGETGPLRVRMGLHAGAAHRRAGDYFGPPVYRAARIMAAAHGGQVLLSAVAAGLARERLPERAELRDLGEHRLKDLLNPEHIYQLVHPDLPSDFPGLATLAQRPNNLPTQTSEFLGREVELASIRGLLDAPGVRLVTLTGPGGIGKTRLALQAAADHADGFEHGLFFVDLSPVREREAAFEAVVRAVGLTATGEERPLEVLKQRLRSRRMLLLLDNFEQVIDAADGVAELLQRCPELKALVTSREALRVRGEHLFPVPPLSVPERGVPGRGAEALAEFEAVRLFVERSRAVRPDFALTDDNAPAIAEISSRLDGLPLAIELAAARLRLFSPHDLRDRLRHRLELLRGGPRDLPARQQTLRGTIEWSYDLLDPEERATFTLLSVFSSARLDSVEDVSARLGAFQGVDVVDRLASLVDKSLVRTLDGSGPQRLSMLETIREFAVERLEEEPELANAARRAHAEHFASLAESREPRLHGPDRHETLDELESEAANLLIAWRYWVGAGDLEQLNKLLDALWGLHDARGWYHAAVELTNDLLGVLTAVPSTPERVREEITLRTGLARGLSAIHGYTEEVAETYTRALALSEEAGALPQRSPVLRSIASFYMYRGDFDKTAAVGRELVDLGEQQHDAALQVEGQLVLGLALAFAGDLPAGLDRLNRAIALFDPGKHGAARFRFGANPGAVSRTTSALLLWLLGYPQSAAGRGDDAMELANRLGHPYTLAYTLFHVGFLDLWRGEMELVHDRAVRMLEVAEEHGYQIWRAVGFVLQGVAATGLGRPEEGLSWIEEGAGLYRGLKTPPIFWPLLLFLRATGLALGGRPPEALDLIDEAIAVSGEGFLYPQFGVLRGDLLLASSDPEGAEAGFQRAFEFAGKIGVRMPQLRAATRLARMWRGAGRQAAGIEMLRGVYRTFAEGFESRDLLEARALLEEADGVTTG